MRTLIHRLQKSILLTLPVFILPANVMADTLQVGPGRRFERIEQANEIAQPGDMILIYARPENTPYEKTAIYVRQKNISFKAMPMENRKWVRLCGEDFEYSGSGSTPRAIFQFNKGADNCSIEGFELFDAHNGSHNGAGVRINQANNIVVRNCNIHNNDMGIMSNGDGTAETGVNQLIECCVIHHNGNNKHPGYNHNLYLGGTSVTVKFCDIHHSLTGHNVKSRAHYTRVLYCYVHHSSNREFDFVDAVDTEYEGSHAVLMGNVIVKDPGCKGNRGVIHFGQDGGREHDGTIFLVHNTIVTPFISPVLLLSTKKARGVFTGNFICDGGTKQSGQVIAEGHGQGKPLSVTGTGNWFDRGFPGAGKTSLSTENNLFGKHPPAPFKNAGNDDYHPAMPLTTRFPLQEIALPAFPGDQGVAEPPLAWEYVHQAGTGKRKARERPTPGAYEY